MSDTGFVPLPAALREEIAPLAGQFNSWVESLITTIRTATVKLQADDAPRRVLILDTLLSALRAAAALKPTVTFEHFCYQVSPFTELMKTKDARFILEVVPRIRILDKLAITAQVWESYPEETRYKVLGIASVLGSMVEQFEEYIEARAAEAASETPETAAAAGNPMEMLSRMLPPEIMAQVQSQGGPEALLAKAAESSDPTMQAGLKAMPGIMNLMQNPKIAELLQGGAGGGGLAGILGGGEDGAGMGNLIGSIQSQIKEIPEDATPEQKRAFYRQIATFIGNEVNKEGSIICKFGDTFEQYFPDGLKPREVYVLLGKLKAFLTISGAKRQDTAWKILLQLRQFIEEMQRRTGKTTLTRDTFGPKITTLVQVALERPGIIENLIEMAINSAVIKGVAGSMFGLKVAEVTKDPFASSRPKRAATAAAAESEEDSWESEEEDEDGDYSDDAAAPTEVSLD